MNILVLGASGMLGNAVIRLLSEKKDWNVFGTLRSANPGLASKAPNARLLADIDVNQANSLLRAFLEARPKVVINCIGLVKQLKTAEDSLEAIPINSLLPHQLARLCDLAGARLIHFSTDCVFSGSKGQYLESDFADAGDIYGRAKLLGEVDYANAVTLRTSIIGHELNGTRSLISWFLSQKGTIKGFTNAVFSGLPTCEQARIVRDFVIPNENLRGVYHVSAKPISKFDLLTLVNEEYGTGISIEADEKLKIDRSLDSTRFNKATNYQAPEWPTLISQMRAFG
ncbi:MAG: SDR family oxidoreductase [Rhodobacteraceae bacterium]|nr:SDR family oxidoreductase [Paracoccaceae bacterium]